MNSQQATHLFKQLAKLRNNPDCTEAFIAYHQLSPSEQFDLEDLINTLAFMINIQNRGNND